MYPTRLTAACVGVDLPSNAKGITKIFSRQGKNPIDDQASVKTANTVLQYCRARDEDVFLKGYDDLVESYAVSFCLKVSYTHCFTTGKLPKAHNRGFGH